MLLPRLALLHLPRCADGTTLKRSCLLLLGLAFGLGAHRAHAEAGDSASQRKEALTTSPPGTSELVQLHVAAGGYGALTGVWIHALTGRDASWSVALPAAALGAAGVGGVVWADQASMFSLGLPQAIATDTLIGFEIAAAWAWHFRAINPPEEELSRAREATLLWSGATLGAGIGILRYALSPSSPGRAAFTGTTTLWTGALSGLIAGALTPDLSRRDDNASRATAFGLEGGVVLGSFLGRLLEPSEGWVRAIDAGALVGGGAASGIYALAAGASFEDRAVLAAGAAGVGAGILGAIVLAPRLGLPRAVSVGLGPGPAHALAGVSLHGSF